MVVIELFAPKLNAGGAVVTSAGFAPKLNETLGVIVLTADEIGVVPLIVDFVPPKLKPIPLAVVVAVSILLAIPIDCVTGGFAEVLNKAKGLTGLDAAGGSDVEIVNEFVDWLDGVDEIAPNWKPPSVGIDVVVVTEGSAGFSLSCVFGAVGKLPNENLIPPDVVKLL